MPNSADIALLFRVSELARRFGLRPSEAEAHFGWVKEGPDDDNGYFKLSFPSFPADPDKAARYRQMKALLGCEGNSLSTDDMDEMEDIVDRALSLAPRARSI